MLNFYHGKRVIPTYSEEIESRWYEYFKINEDNLSDIHHLIIKFENFLTFFEMLGRPSDESVYLVSEIEQHQSKVFFDDAGKALLDIKEVDESLFFCSRIVSDIANLYPTLTDYNLSTTNSLLRSIFDEKYKQQTVKYYLDGNMKTGKKIELDILLNELKLDNSYHHFFFSPFIKLSVNSNANKIEVIRGLNSNKPISFSLKGIGSLLYGIISAIHHKSFYGFRTLEIRKGDDRTKKCLTYPLNVLFGIICIEILSLAFFFLQRCINEKKIMGLAPSTDLDSTLHEDIFSLHYYYKSLRNLHDKILDNYRDNLQKYISELKNPYSAEVY